MTVVTTTDPRTDVSRDTELHETSAEELATVAVAARDAAPGFAALDRGIRAGVLEAVGEALEARRDELVAIADAETGLGIPRLDGELSRSVFQFRLLAEAVREGSYLEAAIDHAGATELGPAPDVRRMLVPIGTVAVFGASNFPFAFSVAGGDTAAALAAGNPVVVKAHPSHPLTSEASFQAIRAGLIEAGRPPETIGLVFGLEAGRQLVAHPAIRAVSLTGSLGAARGLQEIIDSRAEPIPLYGELSSVNPLIVTPGAARARGTQIAEGLFRSFTGSAGQLCTKPGLAFVPAGRAGEPLVDELRQLVEESETAVLLNAGIRDAFERIESGLERAGATVVARPEFEARDGFAVTPTLLEVRAEALTVELAEECFGPLLLLVRYSDPGEIAAALRSVPAALTGSIHSDGETELVVALTALLAERSGRIVYDGYPTGVRVSWAQHHGGPWPSTNSLHTSVGATSLRRFLRPLAWQNAPEELLPAELRDDAATIPRRIDGRLELPACFAPR